MENEQGSQKFIYFLSEKHQIVVVSFVGNLTRECISALDECQRELRSTQAKWIILNFRDVGAKIDATVLPVYARLLKTCREKPSVLRLSSLHPELRKALDAQGILRSDELANNVAEAIKSLPLEIKMVG